MTRMHVFALVLSLSVPAFLFLSSFLFVNAVIAVSRDIERSFVYRTCVLIAITGSISLACLLGLLGFLPPFSR